MPFIGVPTAAPTPAPTPDDGFARAAAQQLPTPTPSPTPDDGFARAAAQPKPTPRVTRRQASAYTAASPSPGAAPNVDGWIRKYSGKYSVPYGIARSVIFKESSNNPNAPDTPGGEKGVVDVGLGQVGTDVGQSEGYNVRVPEQNVAASMEYLSRLYQRFGDWPTALSAYNAGPGNVSPHHPAAFNREYVSSIMGWADAYNRQLAQTQNSLRQSLSGAHAQVTVKQKTHPSSGFLSTVGSVLGNFFADWDKAGTAEATALDGFMRAHPGVGNIIGGVIPGLSAPQQINQFIASNPTAANMMQRIATVGEFLPEAFNAEMRNIGAGHVISPNGPGSQALRATLLNPNLTLSQKLDAAYNQLGVNSPGELAYWAQQPGVRELLSNAQPKTPGGMMLQLMLAGHADLARFKPAAPHLTGAETFGIELFNPTLPAFLKGAKVLTSAVVHAGGTFADAAMMSAAARAAREADAAANARAAAAAAGAPERNFQYAPTKSNLPMIPEQPLSTPIYDQFVQNPEEFMRRYAQTAPERRHPAAALATGANRGPSTVNLEQPWLGNTTWATEAPAGKPFAVSRYFASPNTGEGARLRGGTSYFATDSRKARIMETLYKRRASGVNYTGEGGDKRINGYVVFHNPIYVTGGQGTTASIRALETLRAQGDPEALRIMTVLSSREQELAKEDPQGLFKQYGVPFQDMVKAVYKRGVDPYEIIANRFLQSKGYDAVVAHDAGHPGEVVMLGDHKLYNSPNEVGSTLATNPQTRYRVGMNGSTVFPHAQDNVFEQMFQQIPHEEPPLLPAPLRETAADGSTPPSNPGFASKLGAAFGYRFHNLTNKLGPAYTTLLRKAPEVALFGDRYLNYAKVYGPVGEFDAANFVARHQQLKEENIRNLNTMELYGGLNQRDRIQLHITVNHLPGYLSGAEVPPPEIIAPRTGGSLLQRALRLSDMQFERWQILRRLDPDTAKNLVQPQAVVIPSGLHKSLGLDESFAGEQPYNMDGKVVVGKAKTVLPYAPQLSTWANQSELRTITRGGYSGMASRPGTVQRVRTMDDAISGNAELSKRWNPAGDMVTRLNGVDHYIEYLHQLLDVGQTTMVPHLQVPATMPIEYKWPGAGYFRDSDPAKDVNFHGAVILDSDGNPIDLAQPRVFGKGRAGFENYKKFEDQIAQVYAKLARMKDGDPSAAGVVHRAVTREFADAYPEHEVKASDPNFANTPGLKGYAVERTYLQQVMDANPRVRYSIGGKSSAIPPASMEEIQRAFTDLTNPDGDRLDWKNMTAKELAETHFRADSEDAPLHNLIGYYDFINAQMRTVALSNFVYHPLFNSYPAMLTLLLEHAGMNPVKIARYGGGLTRALGIGLYKTGKYFSKGASDVLGTPELPTLPTWLDQNPAWLNRAQQYNVLSHGFGLGLPAADYVRLMSFPVEDLPTAQKAIRASMRMQEVNKTAVFDIQEAQMLAYAHHILTDVEGMDPRVAARAINKAVNDYSNLTGAERDANLGRVLWFYPWFRMQMHRAWNVLKNNPQIPAAMSNAIYRNNQTMGDQNPSNSQIDLRSDGQGGFQKMSASASTYRFPIELTDLADGFMGNTQGTSRALDRILTANLSPLPSLALRGLMTQVHHAQGNDMTPNAWDNLSGLYDAQQPLSTMLKQAAGQVGQKFLPYSLMPTNYDSLPSKTLGQMRGVAESLRKDVVRLNRQGKYEQAKQLEGLITRLDNQDVTALHAAKFAESRYSTFNFTPKVRGGGGF